VKNPPFVFVVIAAVRSCGEKKDSRGDVTLIQEVIMKIDNLSLRSLVLLFHLLLFLNKN